MIKPTTYIRNYSTYWNEILPGSNRYVKDINIKANQNKEKEKKIDIDDRSEYRYLTSEFAYLLFIEVMKDPNRSDFLFSMNARHKLYKELSKSILKDNPEKIKFNTNEIDLIKQLATRIFFRYYRNKLNLKPLFKGCGLISEGEGDLSYGKTLVELKSGLRNFGISDIRQLLIYCTLQYSSDSTKAFKYVELYNPRMGLFWRSSIEKLVLEIAGCSAIELYNEIIFQISDSERAI